MRSAESAIGVSGFLISCATRRATSRHAACFCAFSRSLRSSKTITYPRRRRVASRSSKPPSLRPRVTCRRSESPSVRSWCPCGRPCASAAVCLRPLPARLSAGNRSAQPEPDLRPGLGDSERLKHPYQRRVHSCHLSRPIHRKHARGNALQDRLHLQPALFQPQRWPPATGCDCSPVRRPCC